MVKEGGCRIHFELNWFCIKKQKLKKQYNPNKLLFSNKRLSCDSKSCKSYNYFDENNVTQRKILFLPHLIILNQLFLLDSQNFLRFILYDQTINNLNGYYNT